MLNNLSQRQTLWAIFAITAAVLGVVFFFRNIRTYIKSIFTRTPKKQDDNNPPA